MSDTLTEVIVVVEAQGGGDSVDSDHVGSRLGVESKEIDAGAGLHCNHVVLA